MSLFFGRRRPARQALCLVGDPPSQESAPKRVQASRQRKTCRRPNPTSARCIFGCGAHTRAGSGADTAAERLVCIAIPFTGHSVDTVTVAAPGGTPLRVVFRPGSGAPPMSRDSFRGEVGSPAMQTSFGTEATRAAGHVAALGLRWEPTAGLTEGVGLKHMERSSLETEVRSTDAGCRDGRGAVARPPQRLYRRGRVPFGVSGADGASRRHGRGGNTANVQAVLRVLRHVVRHAAQNPVQGGSTAGFTSVGACQRTRRTAPEQGNPGEPRVGRSGNGVAAQRTPRRINASKSRVCTTPTARGHATTVTWARLQVEGNALKGLTPRERRGSVAGMGRPAPATR